MTSTAEDELINGWTAYMAGAVAGKLTGEMIVRECCKSDLGGEWNMVRERGVFAGGRWIYIRGGPREGRVRGRKMMFSREMEKGGDAGGGGGEGEEGEASREARLGEM